MIAHDLRQAIRHISATPWLTLVIVASLAVGSGANAAVYSAVDANAPATLSSTVIADVIRGRIGFDGVLVSDDLSMQALGGSYRDRASKALAAGCDLVLHCNGKMAEMVEVVAGTSRLTGDADRRLARGAAMAARQDFDRAEAERRFDALFAGA